MKTKLCQRCGQNRAVIRFCDPCAREINRAHEHVVERTQAAVCYLNNKKPSYNGNSCDLRQIQFKREETLAFLQIFHPEMSTDRAMEIAHNVAES